MQVIKTKSGRGDRIRTYDLLVPNQALYQAKLHPETNCQNIRVNAGARTHHQPEPMAEGAGFEPAVSLTPRSISSRVP